MTCQELIEYLKHFDPDEMVSVLIANPQKRTVYTTEEMIVISDMPCLTYKVGEEKYYNELVSDVLPNEE